LTPTNRMSLCPDLLNKRCAEYKEEVVPLVVSNDFLTFTMRDQ